MCKKNKRKSWQRGVGQAFDGVKTVTFGILLQHRILASAGKPSLYKLETFLVCYRKLFVEHMNKFLAKKLDVEQNVPTWFYNVCKECCPK